MTTLMQIKKRSYVSTTWEHEKLDSHALHTTLQLPFSFPSSTLSQHPTLECRLRY